mmetsp:Transcript_17306/g.46992  ORF Transcript_17306/g.46992 Transcript_17306/m.46992 type:complete len:389 (-) Transcript_17306:143-1309(-)
MGVCWSEDGNKLPLPEAIKGATVKAIAVAVIGARNVRDLNWQPSDKFTLCCSVGMVGKDETKFMTKQVKDLPSPSWREEFIVRSYEEGDSLEFTVWDCIDDKREVLAKAYIEANRFDPKGFCGEIPLELAEEDTTAFLKVKIRALAEQYPADSPPAFPVVLTNTSHTPLGIDFDIQDGTTVHVMGLRGGLVQNYNKTATADFVIKPGDFIMKVNQVQGSAQQLLEALKSNIRLELLLRRPLELVVAIAIPEYDFEEQGPTRKKKKKQAATTCTCAPPAEEKPKSRHGMEFVPNPAGMSLVIANVIEGGPLEEWNNRHPEAEVRPGDRIVALQGKRGSAEDLLRQLEASDRFQMQLIRPADPIARLETASSKRFSWDSQGAQVQEYRVN